MNPLAFSVYLLGVLLFMGGILYFILRRRKRGIVLALIGILIAILPFAVNIWLMH